MTRKTLLQRIKDDLAKFGYAARTTAARLWLNQKLRSKALNLGARRAFVNANALSRRSFRREEFIGHMFFFFYDAKLKKKLPYWDKFPLVIPIEIYPDGFLGLNLHYLHPGHRAILLDKLETTLNNRNYDETTRMRISYGYLKRAARIMPPEAKPCIKRYLTNHIQSKLLPVSAEDWDTVIFLPWEDYTSQTRSGVNKHQVWTDSQTQF